MKLIKYDAACKAIAAAKSIDEVKKIRDIAIAMAAYARQANNKSMEADAAEIRMRATHGLGKMKQKQKETVGLAVGGEHGGRRQKDGSRKNPPNAKPTLASQGIDKNLAHQATVLAGMPDEKFEQAVADARDAVTNAVKRVVHAVDIEQTRQDYAARTERGATVSDLNLLVEEGKKFAVIYADPPWTFSVYSGKGKQRSAERHYDTMSLADIAALPVPALAADDCALLLWCVMPELPGALSIIERWGFKYKTAGFVWIKQNRGGEGLFMGMGFWTRSNAELCLLATKGSPTRLAMDVHQVIMSPVGEHSEKPAEARKRIERLLPGPRLELFARQNTEGWTTWGNELCQEN